MVEFYFDFLSPYSYLAWVRLNMLRKERNRLQIRAYPVVFAAFLNLYGHRGPAEVPVKKIYMIQDIARIIHRESLPVPPLGLPPNHPYNPLLSLRVASLPAKDSSNKNNQSNSSNQFYYENEGQRFQVIDRFFKAVWGGDGGVEDPENVKRILKEIGLDADKVLAAAHTQENKECLRQSTQRAIDLGGFGVPTMFCQGELFWGFDSFPSLILKLDGKLPVFKEIVEKWKLVKPSASRL